MKRGGSWEKDIWNMSNKRMRGSDLKGTDKYQGRKGRHKNMFCLKW